MVRFYMTQPKAFGLDFRWLNSKNYAEPEIYDNIKNPIAHVTMARWREAVYLNGLKQPELNGRSFEVNNINLMESELTRKRPYYRVIKKFLI